MFIVNRFNICTANFITRQHAYHAERDIVLPMSSIHLSVCPSRCGMYLNRHALWDLKLYYTIPLSHPAASH